MHVARGRGARPPPTSPRATCGLAIVSDDGAQRTRIATDVANPSWSPDGQHLVVEHGDGLAIVAAAGGAPQPVAGSRGLFGPAWSPDGRTLAAAREREGATEIMVLPAAGGEPRAIVTGGFNVAPAWSPDGSQLAFSRLAGSTELMVVGADGSGLRRITGDGFAPAWAPDGSRHRVRRPT